MLFCECGCNTVLYRPVQHIEEEELLCPKNLM